MCEACTRGPVDEPESRLISSVTAVQDPCDSQMLLMADTAVEDVAGLPGIRQLVIGHGQRVAPRLRADEDGTCHEQRPRVPVLQLPSRSCWCKHLMRSRISGFQSCPITSARSRRAWALFEPARKLPHSREGVAQTPAGMELPAVKRARL